jgi:hypothetical protein
MFAWPEFAADKAWFSPVWVDSRGTSTTLTSTPRRASSTTSLRDGISDDLAIKYVSGVLQSRASRAAFLAEPTHSIEFHCTPKHASSLNQVEIWQDPGSQAPPSRQLPLGQRTF